LKKEKGMVEIWNFGSTAAYAGIGKITVHKIEIAFDAPNNRVSI